MKRSKIEQETIINYNQGELTANVFTFDPKMMRRLRKLHEERPSECEFVKEGSEGAEEYNIPKKWIKINATKILSEEQKERLRHQIREAREKTND